MTVGVVAHQVAVIDPDDALSTKTGLQTLLNLQLRQRLIAVRGHEALGGGEDGATAVALDGTALKHEVQTVDILALYATLVVETTVDGVVEAGLELLTPAVETEVEQARGGG